MKHVRNAIVSILESCINVFMNQSYNTFGNSIAKSKERQDHKYMF